MLQTLSVTPSRRSLEFGIYRDGDNNLDAIQESTLAQALRTSAADSRIEFTVEDTTRLRSDGDAIESGDLRTERYVIADGGVGQARVGAPQDMSDEQNLAQFVARTLDNAQATGAKQTWVELVDHGGGDGGGLETADGSVMSMPDIARAIADGVAMHAAAHPEDAGRSVDGVVANQCLMETLGFADALSHAGVRYLAASPETMLAPGVPSDVAHSIASNERDPSAMAKAVVNDVMRTKYDAGGLGRFGPAAAFDVLDLNPSKLSAVERSIKGLNDDVGTAGRTLERAKRCARGCTGDRGDGALSASRTRHAVARRSPGYRLLQYARDRRAPRRAFAQRCSACRERGTRSRAGTSRKRRLRAFRRSRLLRRRRTNRSPSHEPASNRSVGIARRRRNEQRLLP